jgi:hypothetical protein
MLHGNRDLSLVLSQIRSPAVLTLKAVAKEYGTVGVGEYLLKYYLKLVKGRFQLWSFN